MPHCVRKKRSSESNQSTGSNWAQHLAEIKIGDSIREIEIVVLPPGTNAAANELYEAPAPAGPRLRTP